MIFTSFAKPFFSKYLKRILCHIYTCKTVTLIYKDVYNFYNLISTKNKYVYYISISVTEYPFSNVKITYLM